MMGPREETIRQFEPCSRLKTYLNDNQISYARLSYAGLVLRIPITAETQAFLAGSLITSFRHPVTPYTLCRYRKQGEVTSGIELLFNQSLACLGLDHDQFLGGCVPFNHLAFMMWVCSAVADSLIHREVAAALKQPFVCQLDPYRISDWINGHRYPSVNAQALTVKALRLITRDVGLTEDWLFEDFLTGQRLERELYALV